MKRFLIKAGLQILFVLGLLFIYNIYFSSVIRRVNTLPSEARILAMGSSHIECGVNDKLYPIFNNRASSAEGLYFSYHKLIDVVEENNRGKSNQIDALCLSYHFFTYKINKDNCFLATNSSYWIDKYLPIYRTPENLPTRFGLPIKNEYILLLKSYLPNMKYETTHLGHRGGFHSSSAVIKQDNKESKDRTIKQIVDDIENLECYISSTQVNLLQLIAEYTEMRGIQLFLVNTPLHSAYTSQVPDELKLFHSDLAQRLNDEFGVIYLDYHTMNLQDSCFRDLVHLNANGAKIFTPRLLEDVTINMQRLGKW